jgi:hypothetical protein
VLVVPQGREHEFSFSTDEGCLGLCVSSGFSRLIFVSLCRGHRFKVRQLFSRKKRNRASNGINFFHPGDIYDQSLASIQAELNAFMKELAPQKSGDIPYLTPSGQDDIGSRQEIVRGASALSGEYIVEEVCPILQPDSRPYALRRLIFLSNRALVQSEARRWLDSPTTVFDASYLACGHHESIIAGLFWATGFRRSLPIDADAGRLATLSLDSTTSAPTASIVSSPPVHVALIGVGGGLLTMFMHEAFNSVHIDAVDLDAAIVGVAQSFFGFSDRSDRLSVYIGDGLVYVDECARNIKGTASSAFTTSPVLQSSSAPSQSDADAVEVVAMPPHWWRIPPYAGADHDAAASSSSSLNDVIIVDVDSKVLSSGLSCPPEVFVTEHFFRQIKLSLAPGGVFLLNLVCRAKALFAEIVERCRTVFAHVHLSRVPEDVNCVLICTTDAVDPAASTPLAERIAAVCNRMIPSMRHAFDMKTVMAAIEIDPRVTPAPEPAADSAPKPKSRKKK